MMKLNFLLRPRRLQLLNNQPQTHIITPKYTHSPLLPIAITSRAGMELSPFVR